jgi:malonyl-CoA/methylmalonyl-CoA synthetase
MNHVVFRELLTLSRRQAVSSQEVTLTFQTFAQRCFAISRYNDSGPTAILAPSSIECATALFGTWLSGQAAIPLQITYPVEELLYILRDSRPTKILAHPAYETLAKTLGAQSSVPYLLLNQDSSIEPMRSEIRPNQGALVIYTSGTTNKPKGVVTTFAGLEAQVESLLTAWKWTSNDRTLNVLPLHHVHGVVNVLTCALAAGAHCEISERFEPSIVWNKILEKQINVFMAVPTIYQRLIKYWEGTDSALQKQMSLAARSMRLFVSGSAALPAGTFSRWHSITGHNLLERYGMTEIGMALSNPYEGERKVGTVGLPLPGVEVRLRDGEIQVRGKTVFKEYLNQPELTHESFTNDGWFKTGDVAEKDADGYYRILGRQSQDIIKSGGYKISALEIESVLSEYPDLSEIAVVGIVDSEWGERVAAAIVTTGNSFSEEKIKSWAKDRLAGYKIPTRWLSVRELPRNSMGKILKPKVRELFS